MSEMNNNDLSTTLVQQLLKEQRWSRRFKMIRFVCWFLLFAFVIFSIFHWVDDTKTSSKSGDGKHVALIRLDGMIAPDRDFSAEKMVPALKEAFSDKNASGLIISINSPGGTPVQAAIIHDAIIAYKKEYKKKVIVIGEDMLTSGAYFVAVAADKIYVNPSTITGSIGVIMKGFGFVDAMKKMGVERRVYTAGIAKDRLDPFLPQNPEDLKKIESVMTEVHQNFIKAVEQGRKGKLKADSAILFSGDFWSGQTAVELGLVDGLGNLLDVMKTEFNTSEFKEYSGSSNFFRLLGGQINSAADMVFSTYFNLRPSS